MLALAYFLFVLVPLVLLVATLRRGPAQSRDGEVLDGLSVVRSLPRAGATPAVAGPQRAVDRRQARRHRGRRLLHRPRRARGDYFGDRIVPTARAAALAYSARTAPEADLSLDQDRNQRDGERHLAEAHRGPQVRRAE